MFSVYEPFLYFVKAAYVVYGFPVRIVVEDLLLFYYLLLFVLYVLDAVLVQDAFIDAYGLSYDPSDVVERKPLKRLEEYCPRGSVPRLGDEVSVGRGYHLFYLVVVRKGKFQHHDVFFEFGRNLAQGRREDADRRDGALLFVYYGGEVPEFSQEFVRGEISGNVLEKKQAVRVFAFLDFFFYRGKYLFAANGLFFLFVGRIQSP